MPRPRTLTVPQCAALVGASARTVAKWIDKGVLPGHRLPWTRHRRVYADDLAAFLTAHSMRVPAELGEPAPAPLPRVGEALTADEVLRLHVTATLERLGHNRTAAAEALGVCPKTLYNWLAKWEGPDRAGASL
jgi:excisionase family DNA binding protein